MNTINFFLQANVYLILFYCFYLVLLRTETFFSLNRVYLLSSALLSCCIPLLHSAWINSLFNTDEIARSKKSFNLIIDNVGGFYETQSDPLSPSNLLLMAYVTGLIIVSGRFILRLVNVLSGRYNDKIPAFSFFNKIVVSKELGEYETIYAHEEVHSKQLHSADVIFFELLTIIFWFNPVVYLYRNAAKNIHEFIADELASQADKAGYATLLLCNTLNIRPDQLTNSFYNQSMLKKRITMLQKTRSRKAALLKYGLSAPLFAAMLIFSSAAVMKKTETIVKETELNVPPDDLSEITSAMFDKTVQSVQQRTKKILADTVPAKSATSLDKVDVLPEYPGGMPEFYNFVGKKFKYPADALKNGVSGKVTVSFTVEKDGSLTNFKTLKDLGYGTGDAAIAVLKQSPKWRPAIKEGKPVRVIYTLPISLNSSKTSGVVTNGSADPLFVVDGVETSSEQVTIINPKSIKAINIVKGEAATSQYGEKGAKGVVQVYITQEPPKALTIKKADDVSVSGANGITYANGTRVQNATVSNFKGLVVIDGVARDSTYNLNSLKPEEIQSMNVVSGDKAVSKYGDKGKYGVIEINIKK